MFQTAEYLGYVEVAKRLGVSRQRAHQLCNRKDFPDPAVRVGKHPGWSEEQIDWYASKRRPTGRPRVKEDASA